MAHRHPLFKTVVVPCLCCGRNCKFTFASASDQVICPHCVPHLGDQPSKQLKREREHVAWWQQCEQYWQDAHAEEIRQLNESHAIDINRMQTELTRVKTLVAGLEATVKEEFKIHNPVVATWLDEEAIAEEQAKTQKARNYVAHLLRVLWHVDREHHLPEDSNTDADICRCGVPAAECPTFEALEPVRERLYRWENEEIERLRKGWRHELPNDHPEARKQDPRQYRSA